MIDPQKNKKPLKVSVLVLLVRKRKIGEEREVCLGMKKIDYGKGKWNGFGGKANKGESLEDAALRELHEESKVVAKSSSLKRVAKIMYYEPEVDWVVNVYVCKDWEGKVKESEEMKPKWFSIKHLPLDKMWENDALWMPVVLSSSKKIKGTIWNDENDRVVKYELQRVENLD